MSVISDLKVAEIQPRSRLTKQQKIGFLGCWLGWVMDGVDSFIFALVFVPSMRELLPASGFEATPANIASAGSAMFALFLMGWGTAFIWGPLGDKFGRARTLVLTIIVYSVFTGAAVERRKGIAEEKMPTAFEALPVKARTPARLSIPLGL